MGEELPPPENLAGAAQVYLLAVVARPPSVRARASPAGSRRWWRKKKEVTVCTQCVAHDNVYHRALGSVEACRTGGLFGDGALRGQHSTVAADKIRRSLRPSDQGPVPSRPIAGSCGPPFWKLTPIAPGSSGSRPLEPLQPHSCSGWHLNAPRGETNGSWSWPVVVETGAGNG